MTITIDEGTEVVSSDGKKVGRVKRIENEQYMVVYKKGLLTDEDIRIPLTAILPRGKHSAFDEPVRINMTEESLKHGFEYVKGKPNSDFVHGINDSEKKLELGKQVIHFEPLQSAEGSNETEISPNSVSKQHQAVLKPSEQGGTSSLYSCDMCVEKFKDSGELQKHRGEIHKAAVNI